MTITASQLAKEIPMDKSHLLKLAKKLNIPLHKGRIASDHNQVVAFFEDTDADRLREYRKDFSSKSKPKTPSEDGYLYIVATEPEIMPRRHKIGFTISIEERLRTHRNTSPNAVLIKTWPCRRTWESTAIAAMTNDVSISKLSNEVFDADVNVLLERGDTLFEMLPDIA